MATKLYEVFRIPRHGCWGEWEEPDYAVENTQDGRTIAVCGREENANLIAELLNKRHGASEA